MCISVSLDAYRRLLFIAVALTVASPVYGAAGALDTSFGDGGTQLAVLTDSSTYCSAATALVLQPDGKAVVAAGQPDVVTGNCQFAAVRFDPDGSLDMSFGSNGVASAPFYTNPMTSPTPYGWASALTLQPDGKLVIAGFGSDANSIYAGAALMRFNPDGTLDQSFGDHDRPPNCVLLALV